MAISLFRYSRDPRVAIVTNGRLNQIRVGAWSLNLAGWDDLLNHTAGLLSWCQDHIMEQGGAVFLGTELL